jgi:hypothetical protein
VSAIQNVMELRRGDLIGHKVKFITNDLEWEQDLIASIEYLEFRPEHRP